MNGIQYYLNVDVKLALGHVICLDSPWAVTAISQARFWPRHPLSGYGDGQVKGLLSVDVSNWFEKGLNHKTAENRTRPEIVAEVWAELKKSLTQANGESLLTDDMCVGCYVDSDSEAGTNYPPPPIKSPFVAEHNTEPLLVNTASSWSLRPESFCGVENLFLVSDYVRTNTDLATMEGASEAARRAVNGIIAASGSGAAYAERTAGLPAHGGGSNPPRGQRRGSARARQRHGHERGGAGQDIPALLHHRAHRPGHRTGPVLELRYHRPGPRRHAHGTKPGRPGYRVYVAAAGLAWCRVAIRITQGVALKNVIPSLPRHPARVVERGPDGYERYSSASSE